MGPKQMGPTQMGPNKQMGPTYIRKWGFPPHEDIGLGSK